MDLDDTVRRLAPGLLRFCIGRSGSVERGEEAAQGTLLELVRFWRRNGPPDNVDAWAFTVARRLVVRDTGRRRKQRSLEELGEAASATVGPDRHDWHVELLTTLRALESLDATDREAILLVAAGLDTAAAAAVLGIGRSAFKMRVHRARGRLRETLEGKHARATG